MTHDQTAIMVLAMRAYGGGFVTALARALEAADSQNRARLLAAFPDMVSAYGPGSAFYRACDDQGAGHD